MPNSSASDFCFHCSSDGDEVYVTINSIERFEQQGCVDDSSEFDSIIEEFLPEGYDQATDSTWLPPPLTSKEGAERALLQAGFVQLPKFTKFMKAHE